MLFYVCSADATMDDNCYVVNNFTGQCEILNASQRPIHTEVCALDIFSFSNYIFE